MQEAEMESQFQTTLGKKKKNTFSRPYLNGGKKLDMVAHMSF
jgi:hypothetical protein